MSPQKPDWGIMTSIKQEDIGDSKGVARKLPTRQVKTEGTLRRMISELSSRDDGDEISKCGHRGYKRVKTEREASESDGDCSTFSSDSEEGPFWESDCIFDRAYSQCEDNMLGESDGGTRNDTFEPDKDFVQSLGEVDGENGNDLLRSNEALLDILGVNDGGLGCDALQFNLDSIKVSGGQEEGDPCHTDDL